MKGPCMCGDPYCPSCGDPAAAAFEDLMVEVTDELEKLDEIQVNLFLRAGRAAVEAYNAALDEQNARIAEAEAEQPEEEFWADEP